MTDYSAHFNTLYATHDDPWDYETSPYEGRKYDATCAALTRPRYSSALEAGCSIGVLSARLAPRCDRLLSLDLSPLAVARASERLQGFTSAHARCATLPQDWPTGNYDLIMLSEMIYYLSAAGIRQMAKLVAASGSEGAECVLVHWQGNTATDIVADAARDLFCTTLSALRPTRMIDHATTGEYNHRTILLTRA